MWTGGMTFADSIIISLVGLLVVFSALAVLAIAVIIISKVIGTLFKESAPRQLRQLQHRLRLSMRNPMQCFSRQSVRKQDCLESSSV